MRAGSNMTRKPAQPIGESARREHERPLTQTIQVVSASDVPPGYCRIDAPSRPIFAKAQVLSSQCGRPIFVEAAATDGSGSSAYWVHDDIMPRLAWWLHLRVFPAVEIDAGK